jgi:hypothetical protein
MRSAPTSSDLLVLHCFPVPSQRQGIFRIMSRKIVKDSQSHLYSSCSQPRRSSETSRPGRALARWPSGPLRLHGRPGRRQWTTGLLSLSLIRRATSLALPGPPVQSLPCLSPLAANQISPERLRGGMARRDLWPGRHADETWTCTDAHRSDKRPGQRSWPTGRLPGTPAAQPSVTIRHASSVLQRIQLTSHEQLLRCDTCQDSPCPDVAVSLNYLAQAYPRGG